MVAVRAAHPTRGALASALLLLSVAACGGGGDDVVVARPVPGADTGLTIRVWPTGKAAGHVRRWTLTCRPDGGTLAEPRRACSRLDGLDDPFAPVPQGVAC